MPALVWLGRRWRTASDDFVFSSIIYFIALAIIGSLIVSQVHIERSTESNIRGCPYAARALSRSFLGLGCVDLIGSVAFAITAVCSARGSIFEISKRACVPWLLYIDAAWMITSFVLTGLSIRYALSFNEVGKCTGSTSAYVLLAGIFTNLILCFVHFMSFVITFDPDGVKEYGDADEYTHIWWKRFRLLCCQCGKEKREGDAYKDVATVLAAAFRGFNVVPSDIAAGMLLLHGYQQCSRRIISHNVQFATAPTNTKFVEKVSTQACLALRPTAEQIHVIEQLVCYSRFYMAAYGWLLYEYQHCCSIPELCCYNPLLCCDEGDARHEGSRLCCDVTAFFKVTQIPEEDVLLTSWSNSLFKPVYFVAYDRTTDAVIICIRGTMSLVDVVTDLVAKPVKMDLDFNNISHSSSEEEEEESHWKSLEGGNVRSRMEPTVQPDIAISKDGYSINHNISNSTAAGEEKRSSGNTRGMKGALTHEDEIIENVRESWRRCHHEKYVDKNMNKYRDINLEKEENRFTTMAPSLHEMHLSASLSQNALSTENSKKTIMTNSVVSLEQEEELLDEQYGQVQGEQMSKEHVKNANHVADYGVSVNESMNRNKETMKSNNNNNNNNNNDIYYKSREEEWEEREEYEEEEEEEEYNDNKDTKEHLQRREKECYVHGGMYQSAQYVKRCLAEHGILSLLSNDGQYASKKIIVTGHSLGAGVAITLGILLHSEFPCLRNRIQTYAYAPPGAMMSADVASYCKKFTVGCYRGFDFIPRFSQHTFDLFRESLFDLLAASKVPKCILFMNVFHTEDMVRPIHPTIDKFIVEENRCSCVNTHTKYNHNQHEHNNTINSNYCSVQIHDTHSCNSNSDNNSNSNSYTKTGWSKRLPWFSHHVNQSKRTRSKHSIVNYHTTASPRESRNRNNVPEEEQEQEQQQNNDDNDDDAEREEQRERLREAWEYREVLRHNSYNPVTDNIKLYPCTNLIHFRKAVTRVRSRYMPWWGGKQESVYIPCFEDYKGVQMILAGPTMFLDHFPDRLYEVLHTSYQQLKNGELERFYVDEVTESITEQDAPMYYVPKVTSTGHTVAHDDAIDLHTITSTSSTSEQSPLTRHASTPHVTNNSHFLECNNNNNKTSKIVSTHSPARSSALTFTVATPFDRDANNETSLVTIYSNSNCNNSDKNSNNNASKSNITIEGNTCSSANVDVNVITHSHELRESHTNNSDIF